MSNKRSHLAKVWHKFGGMCHYCDRPTWIDGCGLSRANRRQGTKEHVFPRSFGGNDGPSNYILACRECNNERGTQLYYCTCEMCQRIIDYYMSNEYFINKMFESIVKHNKPNVRRNGDGRWVGRLGYGSKSFDTWEEAIDYIFELYYNDVRKV